EPQSCRVACELVQPLVDGALGTMVCARANIADDGVERLDDRTPQTICDGPFACGELPRVGEEGGQPGPGSRGRTHAAVFVGVRRGVGCSAGSRAVLARR